MKRRESWTFDGGRIKKGLKRGEVVLASAEEQQREENKQGK
jgi:hypothetical protein